ncbi:hypothetical protein DPEC_G00134910 [Dallia pectoralis]|uniref:Uncharacterized protein n=1 Tax=Dallia pectoralis TaxID=75939 RepID=A0ACC2GS03_DALPE|nr:hypothetical protein DPEC_G00134910 [Dallia pectoralis]
MRLWQEQSNLHPDLTLALSPSCLTCSTRRPLVSRRPKRTKDTRVSIVLGSLSWRGVHDWARLPLWERSEVCNLTTDRAGTTE